MKTKETTRTKMILALVLIVCLQAILFGQSATYADTYLKDENGKHVSFTEIVRSTGNTVVVFWESNNPRHADFLEDMEIIRTEMPADKEFRLVAICTDTYHNAQQITSLVAGNNWEFDVYIDINGKFERMNGLTSGLHTIVFNNGRHYTEAATDYASADLFVSQYILNNTLGEQPAMAFTSED